MKLSRRIELLTRLGEYMLSDAESWKVVQAKASAENLWFIPEFVTVASSTIAKKFLAKDILDTWIASYDLPENNSAPKKVGIVMAGNIPLVGFHDFLCVFISGHIAVIKPSSKDSTLIKHLVQKLSEWDADIDGLVQFAEQLKKCDAYIATGSNNTAGYFEYYFGKYPNIIRRNRTSVAIITGAESNEDLQGLADDVYLYFGRGCRNVTKIFVPEDYDFIPLLSAFRKYNHLVDHPKYKNNYDYDLAVQILNKKFYMSNPSILLVEESSPFSPIARINYEFYASVNDLLAKLRSNSSIQCIVGKDHIAFGKSQYPSINDYADGVDMMNFLTNL